MYSFFVNSRTSFRIFIFLFFAVPSFLNAQDSNLVVPKAKKISLPIISIAEGLMNFSGEVGYNRLNEPLTARSGLQIEVQANTQNRFSLALFILKGKTFGDEKTVDRALNFSSSIFSGGLMLRYDFISKKRADQIIIPFLTIGAEYMTYHPYSDLKDANGKSYNYWSDGTIRDIAETDPTADQAVVIYRDYTYETDLREANIDGFGNFKISTWGIPLGGGLRFKISDRLSMHFSSVCHFTGSDYIDGITEKSSGNRQGNIKNDKLFYTSVSFRFALSAPQNDDYNNVDFNALANEDADGDGIPDIRDDSSGTPKNNAVGPDGKPFDNDNDGIPDYRDLELTSASDAVVNEQGVRSLKK